MKIREKNGKVVPFFLSSGSSTNEIKRFFLRDGAVCLFVCLVSSMEELTNYTAYNLFWTVGIELTVKIVV